MSAIISQLGLGFYHSHVSRQLNTNANQQATGQGVARSYVNASSGNLILSSQDERLVSYGANLTLNQTYNSQGTINGQNGWASHFSRIEWINENRISRRDKEGSIQQFTYDAERALFVTTDGVDAHDTLRFDEQSGLWIWKEGSSGQVEKFNQEGQLVRFEDRHQQGWQLTYQAGKLTQLVSDDGQKVTLSYADFHGHERLAKITTVTQSGAIAKNQVEYRYDELGRLTQTRTDLTPENANDSAYFITEYAYDSTSERIALITQGDGSQVAFQYEKIAAEDVPGIDHDVYVVKKITHGDNETQTIHYDFKARTTIIENGLGHRVIYRYDNEGRVVSMTLPSNEGQPNVEQYSYDDDGNLVKKRNASGAVTEWQYDEWGNLIYERSATGVTHEYAYNENHQKIRAISYTDRDPDGGGVTKPRDALAEYWVYDALDNQRFHVSAEGRVTEWKYNSKHQIIEELSYSNISFQIDGEETPALDVLESFVDNSQNSQRTVFSYDARGMLASRTKYEDSTDETLQAIVETFIYDEHGKLLSSQLGDQSPTVYEYDGLGRVLEVVKQGRVQTSFYDANNQRTDVTDHNGVVTSTFYDQAGRLVSRERVMGSEKLEEQFLYDQVGNLRAHRSTEGEYRYYLYDENNQRVGTINELGQLETKEYDLEGRVIATFNYADTIDTAILLDNWSLAGINEAYWNIDVLLSTLPDNAEETRRGSYVVYNADGLLRYSVNQKGEVSEYVYDGKEQLIRETQWKLPVSSSALHTGITEGEIKAAIYGWTLVETRNQSIITERDPNNQYIVSNQAQWHQIRQSSEWATITTSAQSQTRAPNQPYPLTPGASTYTRGENQRFVETYQVSVDIIDINTSNAQIRFSDESARWHNATLQYRLLHNNDAFIDAPVEITADGRQATLLNLEPRDYELRVQYEDEHGKTWLTGLGAFRATEHGVGPIAMTFDDAPLLAMSTEGLQLQQVLPADIDIAAIEEITTYVYRTTQDDIENDTADLQFVTQAVTIPYAEPNYQGHVNFVVNENLTNARYQVHIDIQYKNGEQTSLAPFLMEVGAQAEGLVSQTLRWPVSEFESQDSINNNDFVPTVKYRSAFRNTGFESVQAYRVGDHYQVVLEGLEANKPFEVVIEHMNVEAGHSQYGSGWMGNATFYAGNESDIAIRWDRMYAESTDVEGIQLSGVYSNEQAEQVRVIHADVYDKATGKFVSRAKTFPWLYSPADGKVNISHDALGDGAYEVRLSFIHHNGAIETQTIDVEWGRQIIHTYPTTVEFALPQAGDSDQAEFILPQSTSMDWTLIHQNTDGKYVITLNDALKKSVEQPIPTGLYDLRLRIKSSSGEVISQWHTQVIADDNNHSSFLKERDVSDQSPNGRHQYFFYDADGLEIGSMNAQGYLTEKRYDAAGRLHHQIEYAQSTSYGERVSDESFDALLARVAPKGEDRHQRFYYNDKNDLIATVDAERYLTTYEYDSSGNKKAETRYENKVTADASFEQLLEQAKLGRQQKQSWEYSNKGLLAVSSNTAGLRTQYEYDEMHRLVAIHHNSEATKRSELKRYDHWGQLIAQVSGENAALIRDAKTSAEKETLWNAYGLFHHYDEAGRRISSHWKASQGIDPNAIGSQQQLQNKAFYDELGNVRYEIGAGGQIIEYQYNAFNERIKTIHYANVLRRSQLAAAQSVDDVMSLLVSSADDRVTTQAYDELGRVAISRDVEGIETRFSYNTFGETIAKQWHDPSSLEAFKEESKTYDLLGQATAHYRKAEGKSIGQLVSYDAFGQVITQTDNFGNVTRNNYDHLGRVVGIEQENNAIETMQFDAFGRKLMSRDALNNETHYEYSDNGLVVQTILANGTRVSTQKNALGEVIIEQDAQGNRTRYTYNSDGNKRKTEVFDHDGQQIALEDYVYDSNGLLIEETGSNGITTTYLYDANAKAIQQIVGQDTDIAQKKIWKLDAFGQTIESIDATGAKVQTAYDKRGKTLSVKYFDTDGVLIQETQMIYDERGQQVLVKSGVKEGESLSEVAYEYDDFGRRIATIGDPNGERVITRHDYNEQDQVWRTTDALGNKTYYVYDIYGLGQLRYTIESNGTVHEKQYDDKNQLIMERAWAQAIDTSELDTRLVIVEEGERTIQRLLAGRSQAEADEYSPGGQLNELNRVNQYVYNEIGKVALSLQENGAVTKHEYNDKGQRIKTIQFEEIIDDFELTGGFKAISLEDIESFLEEADVSKARIQHFAYDTLGRVVLQRKANGETTVQSYDQRGNLASTQRLATLLSDNLTIDEVKAHYSVDDRKTIKHYDALNREIYSVNELGAVTRYQYDEMSRVIGTTSTRLAFEGDRSNSTAIDAWFSQQETYTFASVYDKQGNLVYQLDGEKLTEYTYDRLGKVTQSESYGIPVDVAVVTLESLKTWVSQLSEDDKLKSRIVKTEFDQFGRTIKTAKNHTQIETYVYDVLGNVVERTDARGFTTYYAYNSKGQVIRELKPINESTAYLTEHRYNAFGQVVQTKAFANGVTLTASTNAKNAQVNTGYLADRTTRYYYTESGHLSLKVSDLIETLPGEVEEHKTNIIDMFQTNHWGEVTAKVLFAGADQEQQFQFEYDQAGRVITESSNLTSQNIRMQKYTYNAFGEVETAIDPRAFALIGENSDWAISERKRLGLTIEKTGYTQVKRAEDLTIQEAEQILAAYTTRHRYDSRGNLLEKVDANGGVVSKQYDAVGNTIGIMDDLGNKSLFFYNHANQLVLQVDPLGYAKTFDYTVFGELKAEHYFHQPLTASLTETSDISDVLASLKQRPASEVSTKTNEYDVFGRVKRSIDAESHAESFIYDAANNIIEKVDRNGNKTTYLYNAKNQLTRETLPKVSLTINAETGATRFTSLINEYEYDGFGNNIKKIEAKGLPQQREIHYQYDNLGRMTQEDRGDVTVYNPDNERNEATVWRVIKRYDISGNVIEETRPDGRSQTYYYDASSRMIAKVDAADQLTTYVRDAVGNVIETRVYAEPVSDKANRPSVIDAMSRTNYRVTYTQYDGSNHKIAQWKESAIYFSADRGFYQSDARETFEYDGRGFQVVHTDANGVKQFQLRDAKGQVRVAIDGVGAVTAFELNAFGQIVKETHYANKLTNSQRDQLDSNTHYSYVLSLVSPSDDDDRQVLKAYDSNQRLIEERMVQVDVSSAYLSGTNYQLSTQKRDIVTRYQYDALGNRTLMSRGAYRVINGRDIASGDQRQVTSEYDALNRVTQESRAQFTDHSDRAITPTVLRQYDVFGNLVAEVKDNALEGIQGRKDGNDKVKRYVYNQHGHLLVSIDEAGNRTTYGNDILGNVTQRTWQQTSLSYREDIDEERSNVNTLTEQYWYDVRGNQVKQRDAAGYIHQWHYNLFGEMTGKGQWGALQEYFHYDNLGYLTGKNPMGQSTRYFYDAKGNATLVLKSTGTDIQHLSLGQLLSTQYAAQNKGFMVEIARFDARGQQIETISPDMDFLRANLPPETPSSSTNETYQGGAITGESSAAFDLKFHLMSYGSKKRKPAQNYKQYGLTFSWEGLNAYPGRVKFVWDTGFNGPATRGVTIVNNAGGERQTQFQGIGGGSLLQDDPSQLPSYFHKSLFKQGGVYAHGHTTTQNITKRGFLYNVGVYVETDNGQWKLFRQLEGSYGWEGEAPGIKQYSARSRPDDHFEIPEMLWVTQQPRDALRMEFFVREQGSQGEYIPIVSGRDNHGRFGIDISSLANGNYEYYYQAVNASGVVVNGAQGQITKNDSTPIVHSHSNLAKPEMLDRSLQQLSQASIDDWRSAGIYQTQHYNAFGDVASRIDAEGNQTQFIYNHLGQLIKKLDPEVSITAENGYRYTASPTTEYYFDGLGRQVAMKDANGIINYQLWNDDVLEVTVNGEGKTVTYAYNQWKQTTSKTNELNRAVRYEYDDLGHLTRIDRAGRYDDYFVNDEMGQRIKHTTGYKLAGTGEVGSAYTRYDNLGRVVDYYGLDNRRTRYEYQQDTVMAYGIGGWIKKTTRHDGTFVTDQTDYFGRIMQHIDAANQYTYFEYNRQSGWLTRQHSERGQDIHFSYYRNGLRRRIDDLGVKSFSYFEYDKNGRRTYEEYSHQNENSEQTWSQRTRAKYDALGRVIELDDDKYKISYEYDAVGNRRHIFSQYQMIDGNWKSQSFWYKYDNENRFVISQGKLIGGRATSLTSTSSQIEAGRTGYEVSYDALGRRSTAKYSGRTEKYSYDVYGWLAQIRVNGKLAVDRDYYEDGSLKQVVEFRLPTPPASRPIVDWDDDRYNPRRERQQLRLLKHASKQDALSEDVSYKQVATSTRSQIRSTNVRLNQSNYRYDAQGNRNYDNRTEYNEEGALKHRNTTRNEYDAMGNVMVSRSSIWNKSDEGHTSTYTTETRYGYEMWDTKKRTTSEIKGDTDNELRYEWAKGFSEMQYDVNGNVVRAIDHHAGRILKYINNQSGQIISRHEETVEADKTHHYYFFNGVGIGDVGDDGPSYRDYASMILEEQRKKPDTPPPYRPIMTADFDANYLPVDAGSGVASGRHVVRQGETLQSIAQSLWGNASLWYLLADANGVYSDSDLSPGSVLTVPNVVVANAQHTSDTMRPYDPGKAMGNTSPTLPDMPPPPIPKAKSCNPIVMIIIVVVAVVATVLTAGAAAAAMGAASSGLWAAGTAALAGGAGVMTTGVALTAAFVGGVVGSLASQAVSVALGVSEKISWKQALVGGITSFATAGLGALAGGTSAAANGAKAAKEVSWAQQAAQYLTGTSVPQLAARGAFNYAVNHAASKVVGLETSFSWAGLAAASVGNALGGSLSNDIGTKTFMHRLGSNFADAAANAVTRAAFGIEEQQDWGAMFANVLGNTIAGEIKAAGVAADNEKAQDKIKQDIEKSSVQKQKEATGKAPEQQGAASEPKTPATVGGIKKPKETTKPPTTAPKEDTKPPKVDPPKVDKKEPKPDPKPETQKSDVIYLSDSSLNPADYGNAVAGVIDGTAKFASVRHAIGALEAQGYQLTDQDIGKLSKAMANNMDINGLVKEIELDAQAKVDNLNRLKQSGSLAADKIQQLEAEANAAIKKVENVKADIKNNAINTKSQLVVTFENGKAQVKQAVQFMVKDNLKTARPLHPEKYQRFLQLEVEGASLQTIKSQVLVPGSTSKSALLLESGIGTVRQLDDAMGRALDAVDDMSRTAVAMQDAKITSIQTTTTAAIGNEIKIANELVDAKISATQAQSTLVIDEVTKGSSTTGAIMKWANRGGNALAAAAIVWTSYDVGKEAYEQTGDLGEAGKAFAYETAVGGADFAVGLGLGKVAAMAATAALAGGTYGAWAGPVGIGVGIVAGLAYGLLASNWTKDNIIRPAIMPEKYRGYRHHPDQSMQQAIENQQFDQGQGYLQNLFESRSMDDYKLPDWPVNKSYNPCPSCHD